MLPRRLDELIMIAAAGGGLTLDGGALHVANRVQIVAAASRDGARITITNAKTKSTDDLVKIAAAGKGCVIFEA